MAASRGPASAVPVGGPANASRAGLAALAACGLALVYPVFLALMFRSHDWILSANGHPTVSDFLEVWVAGRTALAGHPAAAYDPVLHHAAEIAAAGHPFAKILWWQYPPLFLFVASFLALLPYGAAFIGWVAATWGFFATIMGAIARSRIGCVVVCGTPALFINAIGGQNGALVAALLGATLLFLQTRPVLAGVFLGLLAFKPQFGLLLPLALIAGGYWRAFLSAALVSAAGIGLSLAAFGIAAYQAFLHFMPMATQSILVHGANGWNNVETVYGLVRWLGFGNGAGWTVQLVTMALCAGTVVAVWCRDLDFELKAAALCVCALLMTPYLYIYDFAILVVALGFLYRQRPFDGAELIAILLAQAAIGAFLFLPTPIGLIALAIVGGMVARRIFVRPLARPLGNPGVAV
ncbi:MAG TPA: glycosyltransferase family 87 protein [Rhizomicrobium sp.]